MFRDMLEAKVDTKSKFIDNYEVTDASVHDSQPLDDLLTEDDNGQDFFADSAYTGKEQEQVMRLNILTIN
jgi:IS5 family transposase